MPPKTNKLLGQHWLSDPQILNSIIKDADLLSTDTVIEVGPGPGYLTEMLALKVSRLVAIELDKNLALSLSKKYASSAKVSIKNEDILLFNFSSLKEPYKIVANIPYYLTSNLVRIISQLSNPPVQATLLVQQEVAERINSLPGNMSKLSVFTQNTFETALGIEVDAKYFDPPPKVNSQVIILKLRPKKQVEPSLFPVFEQVVKAGFSEKRKKLRSSLSGGLHVPKEEADNLLEKAGIKPDARAQELNIKEWINLASNYKK